ncbi:MAG: hypothetical protein RQ729_05510 [Wenzhouxiangellaceae bacterium]|nr:hypothetical protein [Wenzhouxiangellaceae bacterium]
MSPAQLPLHLTPPRRRRFANFVDGPNRAVVRALRDGLGAAEGMYLCGPRAVGKSHLALAALADSSTRVASFVRAADPAVVGLLNAADPELAVVEDIEQLAGRAEAERALFNALNRWRAAHTAVLLTGNGVLAFELPDLVSRVAQLTRLTLAGPDDAMLSDLIDQLVADFELVSGRGMREYLLRKGPRGAAELVALFERLSRRAQAERRVVSIPLVREELQRAD